MRSLTPVDAIQKQFLILCEWKSSENITMPRTLIGTNNEGGRKSATEWDEVDRIENDNNKVMCTQCQLILSKKIE